MEHILRGTFGRVVRTASSCPPGYRGGRASFVVWTGRAIDRSKPLLRHGRTARHGQSRSYGMLIARALRGVLKIRYLVLGGAVGGGVTLNKKYQEWKDGMPDLKWLEDVMPEKDKWQQWRGSLVDLTEQVKDSIEIDPRLKALTELKYKRFRSWFDQRLDDAIAAAEDADQQLPEVAEGVLAGLSNVVDRLYSGTKESALAHASAAAREDGGDGRKRQHEAAQARLEKLQDEVIQVQIKYQKEVERLERENKELRKQNLLLKTGRRPAPRQIKKSLIDMYSEVLDELAEYDSEYNTSDHLPRVVVVGDQSSGKTSVLEMIAQARIFPRGAGEMMTRAPVKVTLAEGPYHVAQFRDGAREFDLTKEADLAELRREVELRMRNSVRGGKTVSSEVISMTVKGPGLQRMVLVDLPGVIATQTSDMAADTRDSIRAITQTYMSNPNAIILCIQDGSVDAERSNVTDLVAQSDPTGKRTIFVLTKVDLAEENMADPTRIRRILSGKLFPMKALGYFAVVTGRGRRDDSIQTIREHEERFFAGSRLFKDGRIQSQQVTTRNLSMAVADCFWKMVRESVEQQADAFKAARFNLETEWKNNYPRLRELDRDELFERARGEILDEVVNLSQVPPKRWEEAIAARLWDKVRAHVFEDVYLAAAQADSPGSFNTTADIRLRHWADRDLPAQAVETGWEALEHEMRDFVRKARASPDHDDLFDRLKSSVLDDALRRHRWEDKAADMLRILQLNSLEDRSVSDKRDWDSAVAFLESAVRDELRRTEATLRDLVGPSARERWLRWTSATPDQSRRSRVRSELEKLLYADARHPPLLSYDELAAIRSNLQRDLEGGGEDQSVDNDYVRQVWRPLYRRHFLNRALARAYDCRKSYYLYRSQQDDGGVGVGGGAVSDSGSNGSSSSATPANCNLVDCNDVVLFWRVQQMLRVSSNALRQQIMNREARRLDKELKQVLDDYAQDADKKLSLLTGRRVTLAEELKRVRRIQEKLEEFIQALNKEK